MRDLKIYIRAIILGFALIILFSHFFLNRNYQNSNLEIYIILGFVIWIITEGDSK